MKLSRTDRWILANQYRIMAKLYPESAAAYQDNAVALERGYTHAIERAGEHIVRDDTDHHESAEVDEILAMFNEVQRSYRTLDDRFGIDEGRVQFAGFDGETEGDYLGYAHFVIVRENRYPILATARDLNTHAPMLPHYRRMLASWKSRGRDDLSRDDIVAIVDGKKENGGRKEK